MTERPANRLAHETSPYLRQHAHNPVDWYPWGPEALARASRRRSAAVRLDRLRGLSLVPRDGAGVLRGRGDGGAPERAVRVGEGGPRGAPGRGRHLHGRRAVDDRRRRLADVGVLHPGRPAVLRRDLLPRHAAPRACPRSARCSRGSRRRGRPAATTSGRRAPRSPRRWRGRACLRRHASRSSTRWGASRSRRSRRAFDPVHGGFGTAPKFPQPMVLELCLRMAARGVPDALDIVRTTLDAMSAGGIHDQFGGGFARYSTDEALAGAALREDAATTTRSWRSCTRTPGCSRGGPVRARSRPARSTTCCARCAARGGFSSSQDADTEGVEGKFFVWSWDELVALVGEPAARALGATEAGNWEGTNVLRLSRGLASPPATGSGRRAVLFEARAERAHPGVDDKVLTAWNALAIRALRRGRTRLRGVRVHRARRCDCAAFVLGRTSRPSRPPAPLLARRCGRQAWASPTTTRSCASRCLTLYETTFDPVWFARARELGDALVELFPDDERGGFFQTGEDAERLVVRPKDLSDNAVRAGTRRPPRPCCGSRFSRRGGLRARAASPRSAWCVT